MSDQPPSAPSVPSEKKEHIAKPATWFGFDPKKLMDKFVERGMSSNEKQAIQYNLNRYLELKENIAAINSIREKIIKGEKGLGMDQILFLKSLEIDLKKAEEDYEKIKDLTEEVLSDNKFMKILEDSKVSFNPAFGLETNRIDSLTSGKRYKTHDSLVFPLNSIPTEKKDISGIPEPKMGPVEKVVSNASMGLAVLHNIPGSMEMIGFINSGYYLGIKNSQALFSLNPKEMAKVAIADGAGVGLAAVAAKGVPIASPMLNLSLSGLNLGISKIFGPAAVGFSTPVVLTVAGATGTYMAQDLLQKKLRKYKREDGISYYDLSLKPAQADILQKHFPRQKESDITLRINEYLLKKISALEANDRLVRAQEGNLHDPSWFAETEKRLIDKVTGKKQEIYESESRSVQILRIIHNAFQEGNEAAIFLAIDELIKDSQVLAERVDENYGIKQTINFVEEILKDPDVLYLWQKKMALMFDEYERLKEQGVSNEILDKHKGSLQGEIKILEKQTSDKSLQLYNYAVKRYNKIADKDETIEITRDEKVKDDYSFQTDENNYAGELLNRNIFPFFNKFSSDEVNNVEGMLKQQLREMEMAVVGGLDVSEKVLSILNEHQQGLKKITFTDYPLEIHKEIMDSVSRMCKNDDVKEKVKVKMEEVDAFIVTKTLNTWEKGNSRGNFRDIERGGMEDVVLSEAISRLSPDKAKEAAEIYTKQFYAVHMPWEKKCSFDMVFKALLDKLNSTSSNDDKNKEDYSRLINKELDVLKQQMSNNIHGKLANTSTVARRISRLSSHLDDNQKRELKELYKKNYKDTTFFSYLETHKAMVNLLNDGSKYDEEIEMVFLTNMMNRFGPLDGVVKHEDIDAAVGESIVRLTDPDNILEVAKKFRSNYFGKAETVWDGKVSGTIYAYEQTFAAVMQKLKSKIEENSDSAEDLKEAQKGILDIEKKEIIARMRGSSGYHTVDSTLRRLSRLSEHKTDDYPVNDLLETYKNHYLYISAADVASVAEKSSIGAVAGGVGGIAAVLMGPLAVAGVIAGTAGGAAIGAVAGAAQGVADLQNHIILHETMLGLCREDKDKKELDKNFLRTIFTTGDRLLNPKLHGKDKSEAAIVACIHRLKEYDGNDDFEIFIKDFKTFITERSTSLDAYLETLLDKEQKLFGAKQVSDHCPEEPNSNGVDAEKKQGKRFKKRQDRKNTQDEPSVNDNLKERLINAFEHAEKKWSLLPGSTEKQSKIREEDFKQQIEGLDSELEGMGIDKDELINKANEQFKKNHGIFLGARGEKTKEERFLEMSTNIEEIFSKANNNKPTRKGS